MRKFTLIELLVVIVVIAILISMLLPSLNRAKAKATTVKCLGNIKQLGTAGFLYSKDNKRYFPERKTKWNGASTSNWMVWVGVNQPESDWNEKFLTEDRPLNSYLGITEKSSGEAVLCPTSAGRKGFGLVGTSYYANTSFGPYRYDDNTSYITLSMDKTKTVTSINDPSGFVFMNEFGSWGTICANGLAVTHHYKPNKFTLVFVDGHAEYKEITPNIMNGDEYTFIHEDSTGWN